MASALRPALRRAPIPKYDLVFQVTDWYVPEADYDIPRSYGGGGGQGEDVAPPPEFEVVMFGVTEKGHSVTCRVTDFQPYFYVQLPKAMWKGKADSEIQRAVTALGAKLKEGKTSALTWDIPKRKWVPRSFESRILPWRLKDHLVSVTMVKRREFYGYTAETMFPFAKITVKSLAAFSSLRKYFGDQWILKTGYRPYESHLDPFLRFIHERNIAPCGWVRLPANAYVIEGGDVARTQYVVSVPWKKVFPVNLNKIAPLLVASFDIECSSSHGDFPLAIKDYKKLAQDLVSAAVVEGHARLEEVVEWLTAAFKTGMTTPKGAEINRVYTKTRPDPTWLEGAIATVAPGVVAALSKAAGFAADWDACNDAEEEGPSDAIDPVMDPAEKRKLGTVSQQRTRLENEVVALLGVAKERRSGVEWTGAFATAPLQGDLVIQIGTTVHRYGSDEIIYRHIATLGTCDAIEGADVDVYDTEAGMLQGWKATLGEIDPDILIGYNIFGFDMDYMWKRAHELGLAGTFGESMGRFTQRCFNRIREQKLSSSALGDNLLRYFPIDGVVSVDLLKVMQRDHKLDSYKLDSVASIFLGDNKADLKPREIFEKFGGTSADRAEIARYCLQDCALVNRLLHKLKVLENNIGMGNVCSVPLSYLFLRGQGIKIFSLVAKKCREKKTIIPVIHEPRPFGIEIEEVDNGVGYEGAIVLEPKEGIYLDTPITVLDYSSLYPSSMIERNLSHDCFVVDPEYVEIGKEAGATFTTVTYDLFEGVGDKKTKVGSQSCTFAQLPPDADGNPRKGIIPEILMDLIAMRKKTKKKIEYETVEARVNGGSETVRYAGLAKRCENGDMKLFDVDLGATKHIDAADVVNVTQTYSSFEQAVLDAMQLAYKVTANSLYGQIGSRTSQVYWKDIAACTTATGRERIMMAKKFMEDEYGADVIYGDSVTGDTAIMVRDKTTGMVEIKTMETMSDAWVDYENFRPWDPERTEKSQAKFDGQVWANGKWADVVRVIRHKVNKKMYRVNTFQGCVDVTEDHSIVALNGTKIKPTECVIGETDILHSFPCEFVEKGHVLPQYVKVGNTPTDLGDATKQCSKCTTVRPRGMFYYAKGKITKTCKICIKKQACERLGKEFNGTVNHKVLYYDVPSRELTKEEAWVMGIFFGDGSCGRYEPACGVKNSWAVNNSNLDYLHRTMDYLKMVEPSEVVTFKILDTMESSNVYKLVPVGSLEYMVQKYRPLFYDKDKYKKVPPIILNATKEVKEWFLEGYLTADGCKKYLAQGRANFACKGKIGAMGLYYILKSLGRKRMRVNINPEKENIYFIGDIVAEQYFHDKGNKVMKIQDLPDVAEGQFVYDIETTEGKFNGGVGSIVLFNTDSVMVKFPTISVSGEPLTGKAALPLAIAAGQRASREIKRIMPPPQSLEYEKTMYPFILFSKKRYVGNLYEDDANKKPKQKSMGIALKRRDYAPIVKIIYGGILDRILNDHDLGAAVTFLKEQLERLVSGHAPLEELIISKTLRGSYKNPLQIAHKVLADRMGERDAGNKPAANDRVPYVYFVPPPGVEVHLQGDRIENPDYIREHRLTPDYRHYITNQILKPVSQIFALCVEKLPDYKFAPGYWQERAVELETHGIYGGHPRKIKDRITTLRTRCVEDILFESYVSRLQEVTLADDKKRGLKKKTMHGPPTALPMPVAVANSVPLDPPVVVTVNVECQKGKGGKYVLSTTATHALAGAEVQLWAETKEYPRTRLYNKSVLTVTGAETALDYLSRECEDAITRCGMCFKITDPGTLRLWKLALDLCHTLEEKLEAAADQCDETECARLRELTRFSRLALACEKVAYVFG